MGVVGVGLFALFLAAVFSFGGVGSWTRAAVHFQLAALLLVSLWLPSKVLERAGAPMRFAGAGGLLLIAMGLGFLPIPAVLGPFISPSWQFDRGDVLWDFATLDPAATVHAMTGLLLPIGVAVVVGLWMTARARRSRAQEWILLFSAGVLVIGLVHEVGGTRELFGLFPIQKSGLRFFAPFINPNHFASSFLLPFPLAVQLCLDPSRDTTRRVLSGIFVVGILGAVLRTGSQGVLGVLLLQGVWLLLANGALSKTVGAAVGGLILVPGVLFALMSHATDVALNGRFPLWIDAVWLTMNHWLFGCGAGAFGHTVDSYRADFEFHSWVHAHNEWLEWAAETGAIGVVALLCALWIVRPQTRESSTLSTAILVGICGVLIHSVVDFPLKVPGLAIMCAGAAAWRMASFDTLSHPPKAVVRGLLILLAFGEILSGATQVHSAVVRDAVSKIRGQANDANTGFAVLTLQRWAPWRPELSLLQARDAHLNGNDARAVELAGAVVKKNWKSPRILRAAAQLLMGAGAKEEALSAAHRAKELNPSDRRNWGLVAKILVETDSDQAPQALLDAVVAGSRGIMDVAYSYIPVGVFWVGASQDYPPQVQAQIAKYLLKKGDVEAAVLGFQGARILDPDLFPMEYAQALLQRGDLVTADRYLREALTKRPDDVKLLRLSAIRAEKAEDWSEAERYWKALIPAKDARYRAVLAVERAKGPHAAQVMIARARASGEGISEKLIYHSAEIYRRSGDVGACRSTLWAYEADSGRSLNAAGQRLLARCEDSGVSPP